jgi:hypothetical protein
MTVPRDPVTIEDKLLHVLGTLTLKVAAEVTGRHQGYLNALTHPDRRETLAVRDLELLDLAYAKQTGAGFPLTEALLRRMESNQANQFADAREIGRLGGAIAKEGGEAAAACIDAALSNGDPEKLKAALRELEQSDEVTDRAIAMIRQVLARARDGPAPAPT